MLGHPGYVQSDHLYLAAEAKRRLEMGEWAWRQLIRQGLPQIKQGRRTYVLGKDLIEHLMRRKEQTSQAVGDTVEGGSQ